MPPHPTTTHLADKTGDRSSPHWIRPIGLLSYRQRTSHRAILPKPTPSDDTGPRGCASVARRPCMTMPSFE